MTMTCIAVDDEPLALRLLADSISKVGYLQLVASCKDAFEAMKAIEEFKVDLLFIDIQMPGLSGMQLINTLQLKPLVIFITAYKQYALESYDLDVVDYLVKPVPLDRFIKACNRAKEMFELKHLKDQPANIRTKDYFFVNVDYSQVKVSYADIRLMEGVRDYIKIFLKRTDRPLLVRSSLKAMEHLLPTDQFIRVHKSYLLAIDSITAIRKNSVFVGEDEFPVGETFKEVVEKLLLDR